MDSGHHRSFLIGDRSYLALMKKDIHQMAVNAGFGAAQLGVIDLIIAEIGTNLIKHAGTGEVLVRASRGEYIDIISIDNGPGMADASRMMEDGVSTANTLGGGLGAIKRLSDHCQLYSQKDWGTIVFSRVMLKGSSMKATPSKLDTYALLVPYPGEQVCGDGFVQIANSKTITLFLGDGLGHGVAAHAAVAAAITALGECAETSPVEILRYLHTKVLKTRGLVGTIAIYHPLRKVWQICGVGNIHTRIQSGTTNKTSMAYNGIIGHSIPRTMNEQNIEVLRGQSVVLCSDGIRTRWDANKYPHIFRYDPCILAAALYKDFSRRTDDASVIVSRMI
jgi:anti-sigma regulatory factor (Ser/Thr protein kinase)